MMNCSISVLEDVTNKEYWNLLFNHFVHEGDTLEIRCWKEEQEEIKKALCYGESKEQAQDTSYEVSVKGIVTEEIKAKILKEPIAGKSLSDRKVVPFFTINAGESFSSEHYGTEVYLNVSSSDDEDIIKRALEILDSLNIKYVYDEF